MKIVIDLPDWYIKKAKEIKHPDFVNEAIAKGKPLDEILENIFVENEKAVKNDIRLN